MNSMAEHSGGESLIPELPAVLSWRTEQGELLSRADSAQRTFVRARIESICGPAKAAAMLDSLPPNRRERVELAPETHRQVVSATQETRSETCAALERFCAVERAAQSQDEGVSAGAPGGSGQWSALGDLYVSGAEGDAALELPAPYRRTGALLIAPTAKQTILDGYTPFNALIFRHGPWAVEPPQPEEFPQAVAKVSAALGFIERISKCASAMLDVCLRTVAVARAPKHSQMGVSGSHPESPGLAGITNLHSGRWTDGQIMESLVHEGIHNLIAKLELASGMFTGIRCAPHDVDVHAVSPWSGRRIRLHTYLHACFVWFGLARFWELAAAPGNSGAERARHARKGFEQRKYLNAIPAEATAIIKPEVMAALRELMGRFDGEQVEA